MTTLLWYSKWIILLIVKQFVYIVVIIAPNISFETRRWCRLKEYSIDDLDIMIMLDGERPQYLSFPLIKADNRGERDKIYNYK